MKQYCTFLQHSYTSFYSCFHTDHLLEELPQTSHQSALCWAQQLWRLQKTSGSTEGRDIQDQRMCNGSTSTHLDSKVLCQDALRMFISFNAKKWIVANCCLNTIQCAVEKKQKLIKLLNLEDCARILTLHQNSSTKQMCLTSIVRQSTIVSDRTERKKVLYVTIEQ